MSHLFITRVHPVAIPEAIPNAPNVPIVLHSYLAGRRHLAMFLYGWSHSFVDNIDPEVALGSAVGELHAEINRSQPDYDIEIPPSVEYEKIYDGEIVIGHRVFIPLLLENGTPVRYQYQHNGVNLWYRIILDTRLNKF